MNLKNLVRPNILAMKAYSSARDEFEDVDAAVLLDANENPFNTAWNRYPDPYQSALKTEVGKLKNIESDKIFLGNGSDEAIDLIFRVFCEPRIDNVIIPDPTYGMYEVAAAIQNIAVRKSPLTTSFQLDTENLLAAVDDHTKIIFICNPNNPTGNLLDSDAITKVINEFNGIVVIDEAYIDFAASESFLSKLNQYKNVIILQTFSKAWGLAGLRLGVAYSNKEIIDLLNKVKPPYNLNVFTQQKSIEVIKKNTVKEFVEFVNYERTRLSLALCSSDKVIQVFPSNANFLLVRFENHLKAFQAFTANNLIVRDRSKALNCENCLRITIGTQQENDLIIKTINAL